MVLRLGNSTIGLLVRYVLVGGINALAGYGFFLILTSLLQRHLPWQAILTISYLYPVVVGFLGNKHLVFRSRAGWLREHGRFIIVLLCCIAVNYVTTRVLVTQYQLGPRLAQLIATIISAFCGFLGNYAFAFRLPASAIVTAAVPAPARRAKPATGPGAGGAAADSAPRDRASNGSGHPDQTATGSR
jgi:putative flippase GtrA